MSDAISDPVRSTCDADVGRRTAYSGLAYLICLLALAYSTDLWTTMRGTLAVVCMVTGASAVIRYCWWKQFPGQYAINPRRWRLVHDLVLLANGAAWGILFAVVLYRFGYLDWNSQLLIVLNAGAVPIVMAILTPALYLLWTFLTLFLVPCIVTNFMIGGDRGVAMGLAMLVYYVFVVVYSAELHRNYITLVGRSFAMRDAQLAAETANRAKSEFLANISHELRTPMTGILGMTHLALQAPSSNEQREYLESVRSSGNWLLRLLNELLDFSRIEAGKLTLEVAPFSPRLLVEETLRPLEVVAHEKDLQLQYDFDAALPPWLDGDALRIRQIIINLVGNAIKFTHRGRVHLSLRMLGHVGANAILSIEVTDTGPGISPEKQQAIFEPFVQSDSSSSRIHGGTGLGLSISNKLAHLMGGEIALESELGKGSCFRCRLPLRVHHGGVSPVENSADLTPLPVLSLRILVAEDNGVNRRFIQRLLEKRGHKPHLVNSGLAVLEALQANTFDLILMDIQMPEMDGIEATLRIRSSEDPAMQRLRIIALTAHASPDSRETFLAAGMDDFVTKPVDPAKLFHAVEHWTIPQSGLAEWKEQQPGGEERENNHAPLKDPLRHER